MGKQAVVTGASSGIGLAYARLLAKEGYDLVIVSNQAQELAQTGEELRGTGCRVETLCIDLTEANAAQTVMDFCNAKGWETDLLVNNAGVFYFNDLTAVSPKRIEVMLRLHVEAVTQMTRLFAIDMKARGRGYILNMSSMSAWMAMPGIATYNATKAYILNFSRSMWYELKPYGVSVTAVCPGAVDTGLYGLADKWRKVAVKIGVSLPPEKLAKKALKATFKRKKQVVPGWMNHLFIPMIKHLPDWVVFFAMKRIDQFKQ